MFKLTLQLTKRRSLVITAKGNDVEIKVVKAKRRGR